MLTWLTFPEIAFIGITLISVLLAGRKRRLGNAVVGSRFVRITREQAHKGEERIPFEVLLKMTPDQLLSIWEDGEMSSYLVFAGLATQGVRAGKVLPKITSALESHDIGTVVDAVEVLGAAGYGAAEYAPILSPLINHSDRRVQEASLLALAAMGPAAKAEVPRIINSFQMLEMEQRYIAVRALGCIRDWESTSLFLLSLLGASDERLIRETCWALEKCELPVKGLSQKSFVSFVDRPGVVLPEVVGSFGDQELAKKLIENLESGEPELRRCSAQVLRILASSLQQEQVNQLVPFLTDDDEVVMGNIARVIRDAPGDASAYLRVFWDSVRGAVEQALEGHEVPQLEGALRLCLEFEMMKDEIEPRLDEWYLHEEASIRSLAYQLSKMFPGEERYTKLSGHLVERDLAGRVAVANSLGFLYEEGFSDAALLALSRDKAAPVRYAAFKSISHIPLLSTLHKAHIAHGLSDLSYEVRWKAAEALAGLSDISEEILDQCVDELRQAVIVGTKKDRMSARRALRRIGGEEAVAAASIM